MEENEKTFCPDCGRENRKEAVFCMACGSSLEKSDEPELLNNRYRVIRALKSGAMGAVFEAEDVNLGTTVALKKMQGVFARVEEREYAEKSFRREARILARLHHGGLPKVSDFFVVRHKNSSSVEHYLVMTFIRGRDLETIMLERDHRHFPLDEALGYFIEILEVLRYLHSQKPPVVYRDMKASNVMIEDPADKDEKGRVFLVDFGIARLFTASAQGTMIGTPGYASPEQYKGFAEPRSDIFSLGALMHYLLTGVDPQDPSTPPFTFEPVRSLNGSIPENVAKIIDSMLSFEISERPQNVETILNSLLDDGDVSPSLKAKRKKKAGAVDSSLLFRAISENDLRAVKSLLRDGADPDVRDRYNSTPLLESIEKGRRRIAEFLIREGADVNAEGYKGRTPLYWAEGKGYDDLTQLLLDFGADEYDRPNPDERDEKGLAPLHYAAIKGDLSEAKKLLAAGASIDINDSSGASPLLLAAAAGKADIIEYLISKGAAPEKRDKFGRTPLQAAIGNKKQEAVNALIKAGSAFQTLRIDGNTFLQWAIKEGYEDTALLALKKGADVNETVDGNHSPLHLAKEKNMVKLVKILKKAGAKESIWEAEVTDVISGSIKKMMGIFREKKS